MSAPEPIRKVLVTGAAGYQAGFIIERLRQHFEVTLLDRVAPPADRADLPLILGDITDLEAVRRACRGQEAVVHLVALVRGRSEMAPSLFADVMVKGTWNVAQACVDEGAARVVNFSSVAVSWPKTPPGDAPVSTDAPPHFTATDLNYRLAKVLGEQVCDAYQEAFNLDVIHLRPGIIDGDGVNPDPTTLSRYPDFVAATRGRFLYVDPRDVAQAVEAALLSEVTYGRYHIVAGREDSFFEWQSAAREIGYAPVHNWPEIPLCEVAP